MSATHALVVLSVVLGAGAVAMIVVALVEVRVRAERIAAGLDRLESALEDVEGRDLRGLDGAVRAINEQLAALVGALPAVARKAATVAAWRARAT